MSEALGLLLRRDYCQKSEDSSNFSMSLYLAVLLQSLVTANRFLCRLGFLEFELIKVLLEVMYFVDVPEYWFEL